MKKETNLDRNLDVTLATISVSLLTAVPSAVKGTMETLYSGGAEHVIRATSEVVMNIFTLNLHQAALLYSTHPNEMSATFSFMIAGLGGFIALGGVIHRANHEAHQ